MSTSPWLGTASTGLRTAARRRSALTALWSVPYRVLSFPFPSRLGASSMRLVDAYLDNELDNFLTMTSSH